MSKSDVSRRQTEKQVDVTESWNRLERAEALITAGRQGSEHKSDRSRDPPDQAKSKTLVGQRNPPQLPEASQWALDQPARHCGGGQRAGEDRSDSLQHVSARFRLTRGRSHTSWCAPHTHSRLLVQTRPQHKLWWAPEVHQN